MQKKKSIFDKLRPLLLSLIAGILSVFFFVEIILVAFLIYIWYSTPANTSANYLEEGIIITIILTILTYFMKVKFDKLVSSEKKKILF
ncbi:hypothetical protein VB776_20795 [Arcicella sp. DC2W]|uniref:Uncharacterized protein n=1 Tax=Arcicella gelida TaxID=2984195 RepID=A0ABU5SA87_9BACT|nr:hypothetical protein [Arcicella sp. DC2W]MEA5405389.1 hypothetical protein [Arcicella sp. DC2W]